VFIDIHVHTRRRPGLGRRGKQAYATPEQLLGRYDAIGVERAVLLPGICPECSRQIQSVEEVLEVCEQQPQRFIPFCNVDPRQLTNSPDAPLGDLLEFYRTAGCKGVGEVSANLPFDHPMVENLFRHCERLGLYDEPGLPLLDKALSQFPDLVLLGHSQAFWAEIGPLEDPAQRGGYPKGPIRSEGRVVELMRRHPNLHGDLSANSGHNAVSRDEAFGCEFLSEFQDRLCFGTDICAPDTPTPLVDYLLRLRDDGRIAQECFDKIARLNAIRLLGL
jgi:hypothetical protein